LVEFWYNILILIVYTNIYQIIKIKEKKAGK